MLVSQRPVSRTGGGHGGLRPVLAELQRLGAGSSQCKGRLRQRLVVLAERLARVQALGDEYARVGFSEHVESVLAERASEV